jgi:hypothetical protein
MVNAATNTKPRPRKRSHEPPWSLASTSAASTGSNAPDSTSQKRKSRMPMAVALRNARIGIDGLRTRPMGRPRKMVKPAMAPSARI